MYHNKFFSIITILLILSSTLFLTTCDKNPISSTNPEDTYTLVSTNTIDTEGGEISADELTLTIPAGSFIAATDITILSSTVNKPFETSHTSKSYKIEGLPFDYGEPIKITIKYYDGSTENILVLGEESIVHGEIRIGYTFLPSVDSTGYMVSNLPVPEQVDGVNLLLKPNLEAVTMFVTTIRTGGQHLSSDKHFIISYPDGNLTGAQELGRYLEEAYQKVLGLGFKYDERTNWNEVPVAITLRKLKTGTDGLTSCSWFGNNHGYIEFNTDLLTDLPKLRRTAGHEFFHLIQFLYDSRSGFTKSGYASSFHWVNEASAAWFEEKFTDVKDFFPDVIEGGEHHALEGLQLYPYDGNGNIVESFMTKCYGRTPILKYLVTRYGENIIVKIYDDLKAIEDGSLNGMTTIKAVSQHDPIEWWDDFLKELMLGNIYTEVSHNILRRTTDGSFPILSASDTEITFMNDYPFLSASLYRIQLGYSGVSQESNAIFTISGALKRKVSVFKFKSDDSIEFVGSSTNEITVRNLKTLYDNKWHLYAIVSNNNYTDSHNTSDREINLQIKIMEEVPPPDFNRCGLSIKTGAKYDYVTPDNAYSSENERNVNHTWQAYPGTFSGNTFTASYYRNWDSQTNPLTITGSITATFNEDYSTITRIIWNESHTAGNSTSPHGIGTSSVDLEATDIPLDTYEWGNIYQVKMAETFNHIVSYTDTQNAPLGLGWTMPSYWCNGDSKIYISFSKE